MTIKSTIATAAVVLSTLSFAPPVHALSEELCTIRAALVGSVAQERDNGTSKKKVMSIVLKQLGPQAKGFSAYVDLVYANPTMSSDTLYKLAFLSCRRE